MNTINTNQVELNTEEEVIMNNSVLADFDFSNLFASKLTDTSVSSYDAKLQEAVSKELINKNTRLRRVGGLVHAVHIIKQIGVESLIGKQLLPLAVNMIATWHYNVKGSKPSITHVTRYHNEVKEAFGKASLQVKLFEEAIKFLRQYRDNEDVLNYQSDSPVRVAIKHSGISISITAGSAITPKRGGAFIFDRKVSMIVSHQVLNQYLEEVLKSIRIHNVKVTTKDLLGNTESTFTKDVYKFDAKDVLGMLLLMKINNINLETLFESAKAQSQKILILQRAEGKSAKTLSALEVPTYTFFEKYNDFSVASTKDAKNGIIMPKTSIPRLIEFRDEFQGGVVLTREIVGKSLNRLDKLNNAKILWSFPLRVFVVKDASKTKYLNQALVGGDMLVPDSIIELHGQCRVVTDMDHGGIKSVIMGYGQTQGNVFHNMKDADFGIVSAAGFKGGLLSAAGLVTGRPDGLENMTLLEAESGKSEQVMKALTNVVDSALETITVGDEVVEGVFVTLNIGVTNAYSVDDMLEITSEELVDTPQAQAEAIKAYVETLTEELNTGDKKGSGLRAFVAKQKNENPSFSVSEWIRQGLENKTLKYKPAITRVIYQELQSVAAWHGKNVAMEWLRDLMQVQIEEGVDINKLYAVQYLGGVERTISRRIDLSDITDTLYASLKAHSFSLEKDSSLYPVAVVEEVLSLLGVTESSIGWIQVVYLDNSTVDLPLGRLFTVDLYEQIKSKKSLVITKGLLNSLLEHSKVLMKDDGTLYDNIENKNLFLDADVQRALLGKAFGYQTTKGYYGVILPLVGDFGTTCAGIVNRNRLALSTDTWLPLTLSKAPQYFKGATATYNVCNMNFGRELNCVSRCAIFVNPEIALMFQNDFDGDMMRVSVGSSLPYVEELYSEFNGKWFKNFVEGEFAGNKLKIKAAEKISLFQYHAAVYSAVKAKDNVGAYTANSYYYEGVLSNLVNKLFTGTDGKQYMLTEQDMYRITAIMKMLIQIEAMNNMKQESGNSEDVFITDILLYWKLGTVKSFSYSKTDEQAVAERLEWIERLFASFADKHDVELTSKEIKVFVEAMYYASKNFKSLDLKAMNVFNARAVTEKNNSQIMKAVAGEDFSTSYNFKDSFNEIVHGIDTQSMAYELICATVDMVALAEFRV